LDNSVQLTCDNFSSRFGLVTEPRATVQCVRRASGARGWPLGRLESLCSPLIANQGTRQVALHFWGHPLCLDGTSRCVAPC